MKRKILTGVEFIMQVAGTETKQKKVLSSPHDEEVGKPHKSKKGLIIFAIVILAIAFIMLGFTLYVRMYDKVFPNTYVGNISIGGMTEQEVMEAITPVYSEAKFDDAVLKLSCHDQIEEVKISDLEPKFDNVALTEKAFSLGREGEDLADAINFIMRIAKKTELKPELSYNQVALEEAFDRVTDGYETEPVGYTFTIGDNDVTIFAPAKGVRANRTEAVEQVEKQLCSMNVTSLDLNPVEVEPEPLNFDEFYAWLTSDAQDAYYEKIDGKITVCGSKKKCEVDRDSVKTAIDTLATTGESKIKIPAVTSEPENTAKKLTETLYKDVLGSYSTNFGGSSDSRANNVRLASSRINGTELMPDEEFSYDKKILPRNSSNGYKPAPVYEDNEVTVGWGGGICQTSSTLYASALYANLEILERHNHSLSVGYLPPGLDATIAEGVLDLRFRNSTGYPIKIVSTADGGIVSIKIYGYNPENISVDIERSYSGGIYYVTRVVKKDGVEIKREKMGSSSYGKHPE